MSGSVCLLITYVFYSLDMRFIARVKIPTEAGNKMVKDPNFIQTLE